MNAKAKYSKQPLDFLNIIWLVVKFILRADELVFFNKQSKVFIRVFDF